MYRVIQGDFRLQCGRFEPESFQLILTDPPYHERHIGLYEDLVRCAYRLLTPDGVLVTMLGNLHTAVTRERMLALRLLRWFDEPIVLMNNSKAFMWRNGVPSTNGHRKLLVLSRSERPFTARRYRDTFMSDTKDKRFHEWGFSTQPFLDMIEIWTQPHDAVLDPFMGGGAVGVAAIQAGRCFFGIEQNKEVFDVASERIQHEWQENQEKNKPRHAQDPERCARRRSG